MRRMRLAMLGAALAATLAPAAAQAQYWRERDYRYAREAPPPPPPRYYGRGRLYGAPPPPPVYRGEVRQRCRRGTTGTIIGAIAGGLLGNGFAGRGDRGLGTAFGAGAGALAGREIDRNC